MSKLSGGLFSEKVCVFENCSLTSSSQISLKQNKTLISSSLSHLGKWIRHHLSIQARGWHLFSSHLFYFIFLTF